MIHVAAGSQNGAKLQSVQHAFQTAFGGAVTVRGHDTDSGVSAMPLSDEESILGARNRASAALRADSEAHYGVGLEGNVDETAGRLFLRGWVVIVDRDGLEGIGHSAGVVLPERIASLVRAGAELGPLIRQLVGDTDNTVRHTQGTNGILTNGAYTRIDEFTHATLCALAPFVNTDLYIDSSTV
ncbi:MAG TPA: inosine/xanthosine triphosphatase [Candidatus Saccharimonadales bacterium]|nr:inosine/xanthosine triphosphatase [Candidatus Saccharimonadales bacterium]